MTDSPDIPISEIRIEPKTIVKRVSRSGGSYSPPPVNSERSHVIEVGVFESGSASHKALEQTLGVFHEVKEDKRHISEFEDVDLEAVLSRLEKIRHKVETDADYGSNMERLVQAHEEQHRYSEIRFHLEKEVRKFSITPWDYREDALQKEAHPLEEEGRRSCILINMYEEMAATVVGIREPQNVEDEVRSDLLFSRAAAMFGEMVRNTDKLDFEVRLSALHKRIASGQDNKDFFGSIIFPHFMADLMISLGDADLALKLSKGELDYDSFREMAINGMKKILLDPEGILEQNVEDRMFGQAIDRNLMDNIDRLRNSSSGLNRIYEEFKNKIAS